MGFYLFLALAGTALPALEITWHSQDMGGGSSTGGDFILRGTIGQPDPGFLSGGEFALAGGFWSSVELIQTPGAPLLHIYRDTISGSLVVKWTLPDDEWGLEQGSSLDGETIWTEIPVETYDSDETHRFVNVPDPTGKTFYRLSKP